MIAMDTIAELRQRAGEAQTERSIKDDEEQRSEVRRQKPEIRSQRSEVRDSNGRDGEPALTSDLRPLRQAQGREHGRTALTSAVPSSVVPALTCPVCGVGVRQMWKLPLDGRVLYVHSVCVLGNGEVSIFGCVEPKA